MDDVGRVFIAFAADGVELVGRRRDAQDFFTEAVAVCDIGNSRAVATSAGAAGEMGRETIEDEEDTTVLAGTNEGEVGKEADTEEFEEKGEADTDVSGAVEHAGIVSTVEEEGSSGLSGGE